MFLGNIMRREESLYRENVGVLSDAEIYSAAHPAADLLVNGHRVVLQEGKQ